MKKLLLLAYLFPPIANSGTQRPLKFAKYLPEFGWEPIVLTAAQFEGHNTDQRLLADVPAGTTVIRVPMLNERIGSAVASLMGNGAIARRLGNGVRWRLQNRYRTPDFYGAWRPTAVRAAVRVYREIGFDAIYATGYPWTTLLVGTDVAKATGRPVAVDFRDLWAGEPRFRAERLPYELELAQERSVIEDAHAVVSASTSITRSLANAHPHVDEAKFVTVHNGFDPLDIDQDTPAANNPDRPFRIVFTGVWKPDYNPGELYESIDWIRRSEPQLLQGVEVIAAGFAPGQAARRGLSAYIKEPGVLSHPDAVALMRSADILYLSHTDPERQWAVPGKLYEYLASGRPVLALTYPDRETAQIIRNVGGGIALSPEDPGTLFRALEDAFRRRALEVPALQPAALAAYERRPLTGRLADVLTGIASRAPARAPRMSPAA